MQLLAFTNFFPRKKYGVILLLQRTQTTRGQNVFDTFDSYWKSLELSLELCVGGCSSANIVWYPTEPLKGSVGTTGCCHTLAMNHRLTVFQLFFSIQLSN